MSSSIISTITTTLTSTITTSNYTSNISQSDQSNSSDSGLSSAYIGLIIAIIGLASSCLVQYNIKTVKLCCLKFECNKKEEKEEKEYTLPEDIIMAPVHKILHTEPNIILTDIEPNVEPNVADSSAILILADQEHTFVESTF